jgi:hypothetical protein
MSLSEQVVTIPLKVWQDPQGDVVLHVSCKDCTVYFGCWMASGEPAEHLCKLTFEHAWATRSFSSEFTPYKTNSAERSCIYEIENSTWLNDLSAERLENYPRWREWDKDTYHHYMVIGHDNYIEIIAASFTESMLSYNEAGELRRLIDEA